MKTIIEQKELFKKDFSSIASDERESLIKQINKFAKSYLNAKTTFLKNAYNPFIFNLKGDLESSLYVLKLDHNIKIVCSFDEDPIFDQLLITCFRLTKKNDADELYEQTGNSIYTKENLIR